MFRQEISKENLTFLCGLSSMFCIGAGWACELMGKDNIALIFVGRNLKYLGFAMTGATFAYTGIHCLNLWNDRVYQQHVEDAESHFFDNYYENVQNDHF